MVQAMRSPATSLIILIAVALATGVTAIPSKEFYFSDQLVDHLSPDNYDDRWTQRYYTYNKHSKGPGFPIFYIMGGEGAIEPAFGIYYPFVAQHLARQFGGFVLQAEHRFYGKSQPLHGSDPSPEQRLSLINTEQAMMDYVRLLNYIQADLGCSTDRTSPEYCPVITVGGSYPGFLSAMMRVVHSNVVDIAYAASAPMKFYDQTVGSDEYYDHITDVAESCSPGCSSSVRSTLSAISVELQKAGDNHFSSVASAMGICKDTMPAYMDTSRLFRDELMMVVGYTFANMNMAYYPPGKKTSLYKACQIFQDEELMPLDKLSKFLSKILGNAKSENCFDLSSQLPSGANATITAGDWSGVGSSSNGEIWDTQTCTYLVERIGFSQRSMFPNRPWTMDWMRSHCAARFGVEPRPYEYKNKWRFDDLASSTNATRILFTNGLNDGWSVGGIKEDLSDSILALNLKTGAHHSDLSHVGPSRHDTKEVKVAFKKISKILGGWIEEVRSESKERQVSLPKSLRSGSIDHLAME